MSIGAEVNGKLIHESEGSGVAKAVARPQIEPVRPIKVGE
jgi:hypothetical protein